MSIGSCAEAVDLSDCGIRHNSCIDKTLIEEITGCKYCYANHSPESVLKNCANYDVNSPILCGKLTEDDKVSEWNMKSLKEEQLKLPI